MTPIVQTLFFAALLAYGFLLALIVVALMRENGR
jgi:hypothetical protein